MADTTFKVTLDTRVLDQMILKTTDRLSDFLDSEAESVVNDIKLSFGTSPSVAGDPPGVKSGALKNSIEWRSKGQLTRTIHGLIYGLWLEIGTSRGIDPRPFIGPAMMRLERRWPRDAREFGLVKA